MEVIKLEGLGHSPEDAIVPRDIFLLQVSTYKLALLHKLKCRFIMPEYMFLVNSFVAEWMKTLLEAALNLYLLQSTLLLRMMHLCFLLVFVSSLLIPQRLDYIMLSIYRLSVLILQTLMLFLILKAGSI